jgi:hypothetical protein
LIIFYGVLILSIQVTSPKKGDKLYIGDTYAIRWELR